MEYITGILILTLASIIVWYFLPSEFKFLMPYYWLGFATGIVFCLIKEPYRVERIIFDLKNLLG